jgi:signal transduction histidine kinase
MRGFSKTLRFKLALTYFVTFGAILVLCAVILLTRRYLDLLDEFDERLTDRAVTMVERMEFDAQNLPRTRPAQRARPRLIPYRLPGYYFQLYLEDGTLVEKSRNLGKITLPFSEEAAGSLQRGEATLETLTGPIAGKILNQDGRLRLLTLYHDREGIDPFYLQVAVSLERVDQSARELVRLLLIVILVGLALGAASAYLLARRSLAPIGQIAREARNLGAAHLDQRLTMPPGQDELAELVQTLNDMLERLYAAFKAQERFLANAAHELKTPVAVVLGEAQVLSQRDRTAEEYDRFVANVQDEMRRFGQIVNSMLILARADAGLPLASIENVSINEVVMEAVSRCQMQAQRQEIRLVPTLAMPTSDRPELSVDGDAELLRAAVVNLIRNAIRYSPVQEAVDITVQAAEADVRIIVRDRGPGVPPELADHLFDRFCSHSEADESFKGVGLGLAIAKGVAELHRGQIDVSNHSEGGAEFVLALPTHSPADPARD